MNQGLSIPSLLSQPLLAKLVASALLLGLGIIARVIVARALQRWTSHTDNRRRWIVNQCE